MFSRKYWLSLGCLLCLSTASAATLQEAAWQAAYDGELRCDPIATHNALIRLKDYHRFNLIRSHQRTRTDAGSVFGAACFAKSGKSHSDSGG